MTHPATASAAASSMSLAIAARVKQRDILVRLVEPAASEAPLAAPCEMRTRFDVASNRINSAAELDKRPVTCPLEHVLVVYGDGRIDEIAAERAQSR